MLKPSAASRNKGSYYASASPEVNGPSGGGVPVNALGLDPVKWSL